jgi:hypothetical protein
MMRRIAKTWLIGVALLAIGAAPAPTRTILLRPAAVFDGVDPVAHAGWQVLVTGERIVAVGPALAAGGRGDDRLAGRNADAGDDRGAWAPVPPPL